MAQPINWRQALAEVGLLLLGGLIAFGADAVRDRQLEQTAETDYLHSLREDLLGTRTIWERGLSAAEAQLTWNAELIDMLDGTAGQVATDTIVDRLQPAFRYVGEAPVMATYDDLVNSGDLGLLRSESLRYELASLAADIERLAEFIANEHTLVIEQVSPFFREHGLLLRVYRGREDYGLEDAPLGPEPSSEGVWDGRLQALIATKSISAYTIGRRYKSGIAQIDMLLGMIDAQLGD